MKKCIAVSILVLALAAIPAQANPVTKPTRARTAWGGWFCDIQGGIIVAAGIGLPPAWAIVVTIGGVSYAAGCHVGESHRSLWAGVPYNCWKVAYRIRWGIPHKRRRKTYWTTVCRA